jgi:hypothetical protein
LVGVTADLEFEPAPIYHHSGDRRRLEANDRFVREQSREPRSITAQSVCTSAATGAKFELAKPGMAFFVVAAVKDAAGLEFDAQAKFAARSASREGT